MTKHASRHADSVIHSSNQRLYANGARNPWLYNQHPSSSSSQGRTSTYCSIGGPGPPTYHVRGERLKCNQRDYSKGMTMPRQKSTRNYSVYNDPCMTLRSHPASVSVSVPRATRQKFYHHTSVLTGMCSTSHTSSERPVTPVSVSTTEGIVDPCGGHCRTFERCCHYFLQFFFVIGILAGVSLVLAAYWLHHQRPGGDQLVLVYIGVLMALVCTLLLSIQCSVEREVRRKKKNRRMVHSMAKNRRTEVPMRDLQNNRSDYTEAPRDEEDAVTTPTTFCEMPLMYNPYHYEQSKSCDEMSQSQNGIPWWRRYEMEVTSKTDNIV